MANGTVSVRLAAVLNRPGLSGLWGAAGTIVVLFALPLADPNVIPGRVANTLRSGLAEQTADASPVSVAEFAFTDRRNTNTFGILKPVELWYPGALDSPTIRA